MHLKKPFFAWNNGSQTVYPGVTAENFTFTYNVERYDNIANDGTNCPYYVGAREYWDFSMHWLGEYDEVNDLWTWWNGVRDGRQFLYIIDDTVEKCSASLQCSATLKLGIDSDGDAISEFDVVVAMNDLIFTPEQVYGYYSTNIRLRRI